MARNPVKATSETGVTQPAEQILDFDDDTLTG